VSAGWFVVNTRNAAWVSHEHFGGVCIFESDEFVLRDRPDLSEYVKPMAGFTIRVVPPGNPAAFYHAESVEEDFLVLAGRCLLIVEDEQRQLEAWDFVHCPPCTAHTFVNNGEAACVILATGNRRDDLSREYPTSALARRHGATSGSEETSGGGESSASRGDRSRGQWRVERPPHWEQLPWAQDG
jgi:uncharacterized cupin superfamily protein